MSSPLSPLHQPPPCSRPGFPKKSLHGLVCPPTAVPPVRPLASATTTGKAVGRLGTVTTTAAAGRAVRSVAIALSSVIFSALGSAVCPVAVAVALGVVFSIGGNCPRQRWRSCPRQRPGRRLAPSWLGPQLERSWTVHRQTGHHRTSRHGGLGQLWLAACVCDGGFFG